MKFKTSIEKAVATLKLIDKKTDESKDCCYADGDDLVLYNSYFLQFDTDAMLDDEYHYINVYPATKIEIQANGVTDVDLSNAELNTDEDEAATEENDSPANESPEATEEAAKEATEEVAKEAAEETAKEKDYLDEISDEFEDSLGLDDLESICLEEENGTPGYVIALSDSKDVKNYKFYSTGIKAALVSYIEEEFGITIKKNILSTFAANAIIPNDKIIGITDIHDDGMLVYGNDYESYVDGLKEKYDVIELSLKNSDSLKDAFENITSPENSCIEFVVVIKDTMSVESLSDDAFDYFANFVLAAGANNYRTVVYLDAANEGFTTTMEVDLKYTFLTYLESYLVVGSKLVNISMYFEDISGTTLIDPDIRLILNRNSIVDEEGTLLYYAGNNFGTYNIDGSVFEIAPCAFSYSNVARIIIGDNVEVIAEHAFEDCKTVKSIVIPESIKFIGKYAFYNCPSLRYINDFPIGFDLLGDLRSLFPNAIIEE